MGHLREAIRTNRVTFPSQVPTFSKYEPRDLEHKLAQLYFVMGWDCGSIGARFGLTAARARQILERWRRQALTMGYIQQIPPN
jgi:hypothetical protein